MFESTIGDESSRLNFVVAVDMYIQSGFVLHVVDDVTHCPVALFLRCISSKERRKALLHKFTLTEMYVKNDRGTIFTSRIFKEKAKAHGIQLLQEAIKGPSVS